MIRRVHKNVMGAGNPLVSNNGTEYVTRVCVVECLSFMHKSMASHVCIRSGLMVPSFQFAADAHNTP